MPGLPKGRPNQTTLSMTTYFITGATGFVGSHVAERAIARGAKVRALVRPTADRTLLEKIGAEIIVGDLNDVDAIRRATDGVDVVVNSAAKVGDWGPVEEYRKVNVEGVRILLEAVKGKPLQRFVHVSSSGVYAARHHYGTDETEPLPLDHIDGYTQTKVEAEKVALAYVRDFAVPVTILRPGFIYGPRDRTLLPRMIERLRERTVIYVSRGRTALNTTYVGNIVDAIFLSIDNPRAVGEVFNINDGELVSKRQFFEAVADGMNLPRPRGSVPLFVAWWTANWRERAFRKKNKPNPPRITQSTVKFAGLNLDFSIAKARTVLGYSPAVGFEEGIRAAIEWHKQAYPTTQ